jgi:hypothetical protein
VAPVGSSWNNGFYTYPGGVYAISFKAVDNIGVTSTQFVLVKDGVDVLTQPGTAMSGLKDFYLGEMTIPANAVGTYGIRFEAYDAAGNKYSWFSPGSATIVSTPVYLGGAIVTKTGDPDKLAVGDVFTCDLGTWANNSNLNTPPTCEWVTNGPRVRGTSYTITSEMTALASYSFNVILRLSGNAQLDGYWISYYRQVSGGLETKSDISLYTKTFTK